jgi:hypothetical protein
MMFIQPCWAVAQVSSCTRLRSTACILILSRAKCATWMIGSFGQNVTPTDLNTVGTDPFTRAIHLGNETRDTKYPMCGPLCSFGLAQQVSVSIKIVDVALIVGIVDITTLPCTPYHNLVLPRTTCANRDWQPCHCSRNGSLMVCGQTHSRVDHRFGN